MAIGTGLALLGSAVIGAGGAILSSKAQRGAAKDAADTSLAVAEKNNTLARDIYGQNSVALAPYMTRGNQAGDAMMELLGFMPQQAAPAPAAPSLGSFAQQPVGAFAPSGGGMPSRFAAMGANDLHMGPQQFGTVPGLGNFAPTTAPLVPMGQPPGAVTAPNPTAISAFDRYRDSAGYNFRFNEGARALNTGYAASGLLESGAAQKALVRYGQDFGSNEFGRYLGYLGNQQGVGLTGASALAGVGQNYANSVMANNQAAGDVAANAALVRGNATSQMYGGIAGALGTAFGALGSSYGRPAPQTYPPMYQYGYRGG